jgi:hypothetical protein
MLKRSTVLLVLLAAAACGVAAQESAYGISVPVTITGNALYTNAKQTDDGLLRSGSAGFRAVASPTLNLGTHWFLYSSLNLYSSSYFTGSPYHSERAVDFDLMQAFAGYSAKIGGTSLLFKTGRLSSAFGLAPLEYDDSRMPLLAPPRVYTSRINLRPDQIPCGVRSLLAQRTGNDIDFYCGGEESYGYGLAPVTLYGLPAVEAELSTHRIDMRLQVTNSSPVNPQSLKSNSQFPQVTTGAGYTLLGGLHVGVSNFRGPYLDRSLATFIPAAQRIRDFEATGIGTDLQWSRGSWSTEGEWQRFHFDVPGFAISPTVYAGYAQAKKIISPRSFVAARVSFERFGRVMDSKGNIAPHFQPPQNTYEFSAGYRLNRHELIKAGFLRGNSGLPSETDPASPRFINKVEVQLVTDITAVSRAFR